MKFIIQVVYSAMGWTAVMATLIGHYFTSPIYALFFKDKEHAHIRACYPFIDFFYWLLGIKITIIGMENLPADKPYILMSNHQSYWDIPTLLIGLRRKFAFFARDTLLRVPMLGRDIFRMGHIPIARENPRLAIKQMEVVRKKLKKGKSLLIFPEGTRTLGGKIGALKKGGFMISAQTEVCVIPVYIDGTYSIMNRTQRLMTRGDIDVHIGKPIYPDASESKAEIKANAAKLMEKTEAVLKEFEALAVRTPV
jgi:1-acyl-sn-glycerol-3-phosphate acyltransferase